MRIQEHKILTKALKDEAKAIEKSIKHSSEFDDLQISIFKSLKLINSPLTRDIKQNFKFSFWEANFSERSFLKLEFQLRASQM